MPGLRIRGQETSVSLVVDGELKQGSFVKVENFKLTPKADLSDSDFLGETESEPDIMHHGYDFSWTVHELDNKALEVWTQVVVQLTAGTTLPVVNIVVTKKYRDPALNPVVMTLQSCRIKLDSQDFGNRKDYVKSMFSGKCRTMRMK